MSKAYDGTQIKQDYPDYHNSVQEQLDLLRHSLIAVNELSVSLEEALLQVLGPPREESPKVDEIQQAVPLAGDIARLRHVSQDTHHRLTDIIYRLGVVAGGNPA